ncbi:MAG: trigger factor [Pseudomonadota bacterium]
MQVTETKSEGLKRAYAITVTAADLDAKTDEKLNEVRKDFQMKGFRKGKAPLPLLKKMFGKSVLGEVVQETVESSVSTHLQEQGHRPAQQPDIKIQNENFEAGDDLNVEVSYECLPDVPEVDYTAITLERKTVEVEEDAVEEALGRLADSATEYASAERAAQDKDQVIIDFLGRIDDVPFEGGEAEDYPLVLGSNSFIPGFEDQLVGASAGDKKNVEVTFPDDYNAENLAGQAAVFEVTVKEVKEPAAAEINDEFAKRYGAEDVDGLKGNIRERIGQEFAGASRNLLKRRLLDALDEMVKFELPEGLVNVEAKSIAHQLWHEENPDVEGHDHPEVEPTDEHKTLAGRRVRLGLLLAEIGQKEKVELSEGDIGQAIMAQAQQYPGQEREFFEFVRNNREALESIRAPLFEDKVVDLIIDKANVTDVPVSKDDLEAEIEALDKEDEPAEASAG